MVPEPVHTLPKGHSHKVGPGGPQLTERQKWTRDNFHFLMDHIVCHRKGKSEFRAPKGSASQASAAAGSASRRETVHMEPCQDTSCPESTYDPADMLHPDTRMPTPRSCGVSVTSSSADSDFQSSLVESRRGITELKDIVAKTDDKADNPRLHFCDFLKVEVVQLTRDSYDEFQQETFNLLMRLKQSDNQQRYHHGMGTNTATHSQASNNYPLPHTQMQAPLQQMPQTFTQVPQGQPQQQHLQHSQQHFQQTFTQPIQQRQESSSPYNSSRLSPYSSSSSIYNSSSIINKLPGSKQQHMQQDSQQTAHQQASPSAYSSGQVTTSHRH